jgi:putative pyridoxal-dependent aspartate 1-decarboxylase
MPKQAKNSVSSLFLSTESNQLLREFDNDLGHTIYEYITNVTQPGDLSLEEAMSGYSSVTLSEHDVPLSSVIEKLIARSTQTASPRFVGHMTSALPVFMMTLSKIVTALNQNVVKVETSGVCTALERQVIGILHKLIFNADAGFYSKHVQNSEASLGVACSGGTIANIHALWLARNKLLSPRGSFSGIRENGLAAGLEEHGYRGLCIIASELSHYSFEKAVDILGLGREQYWKVKTDKDYRIDSAALEGALDKAEKQKLAPIAVVGVAGTTETGSVDPLDMLASICSQRNIHFHVDAAWGGPTLLSEKYAHLLHGIERADTVTFDAHKQLYVPVGIGFLLVRDPYLFQQTATFANYIVRKGSNDLGRYTIEGSRPAHALYVKAAFDAIGKEGFGELIDNGISKAQAFAEMLDKAENFEVVSRPQLNIICYRYCPAFIRQRLEQNKTERGDLTKDLNILIEEMQNQQRDRGNSFVSRTQLFSYKYETDITVFRVVLANPLTTVKMLEDMLAEQEKIGKELLAGTFEYLQN